MLVELLDLITCGQRDAFPESIYKLWWLRMQMVVCKFEV